MGFRRLVYVLQSFHACLSVYSDGSGTSQSVPVASGDPAFNRLDGRGTKGARGFRRRLLSGLFLDSQLACGKSSSAAFVRATNLWHRH